MEAVKNDFLTNQQVISSKDTDEASIRRKTLAHNYNFGNKFLDEVSNCYILEENVRDLYKTVISQPSHLKDEEVRKALAMYKINGPVSLKTSLEITTKSIQIKPCTCPENQFKPADVTKVLNALQGRNVDTREKKRTVAKEIVQAKEKPVQVVENAREKPVIVVENTREKPLAQVENRAFKTAFEEMNIRANTKKGNGSTAINVGQKRTLGMRRERGVTSKFVSPLLGSHESSNEETSFPNDDHLKSIDKKMIELIKNEIMDIGASSVEWDDIAGLEFAKTSIQEAVVWPMLRPDIFKGLRKPPKGILLFGPPGTGKTLIGKCIASQSKSTFFSISASSLTSKWIGEGEKMVRALFAVARTCQPAVIFIDEIDSLLSQRKDSEHECSRRMKTEFLVQLDGATCNNENERLLLIGATNRPQELDEAARRRFVKRLYIPLPNFDARLQLVTRLISSERHGLNNEDFTDIANRSDGYSGADLKSLCSEASLGPIRSIGMAMIATIQADDVRPLQMVDFENAFLRVRSSVSSKDLDQYVVWDRTYGAGC